MAKRGLRIVDKRLAYIQQQVPEVRDRALASMLRGVKPEAARLIAADILNLPARTISGYLGVRVSKADSSVVVSASLARVPLLQFKPSVSPRAGVTVTTWRDRGAQHLPHAFKRRDGVAGIWQRTPAGAGGKGGTGPAADYGAAESGSGLVRRLHIVERKGPSMARIFKGRNAPTGGHGDIGPRLGVYARARLAEEMARMMKAGL
jgi:hypothetical protein